MMFNVLLADPSKILITLISKKCLITFVLLFFIDRLKKILGKRSTSARTSAVESMVVSPPAESQDEEPPNIGSGNEATMK